MKNNVKRFLALILALCMMTAVFAGCNGNIPDTNDDTSGENETSDKSAIDTSKKVDLVFYLVGDAPVDMPKVEEKINELLLEKINATVTFNFTTWTDYTNKYKMVLSSGEDCDLIYTANWMSYAELAKDDAFLPLDDLLKTHMPKVDAAGTKQIWDQMRVNGKIYSVPAFSSTYTTQGFAYREDLRVKYDLPVPDSLENLEKYLAGVKENEPDQQLLSGLSLGSNSSSFITPFSMAVALDAGHGSVEHAKYGLQYDYNNPGELINYWESDQFRADMKLMKSWADKGFWPKNVLSYAPEGELSNGGCVAHICNIGQYIQQKDSAAATNPDWQINFISFFDIKGIAYPAHPTQNGTAIPVNSKNPERAAMALELFCTDPELHNLLLYGIEGEHYTVDANGFYVSGPSNDNYIFEASNAWGNRNEDIDLIREVDDEKYKMFSDLAKLAQTTKSPDVNFIGGFIEDDADYSAEKAALINVVVEYLTPIQVGMVEDVDAAIDEFLEQAEIAGLSKIQEGFTKQWKAYCEELGY